MRPAAAAGGHHMVIVGAVTPPTPAELVTLVVATDAVIISR